MLGMIIVTPVEAGGHNGGGCEVNVDGQIIVPTFRDTPPPLNIPTLSGVTIWWIGSVDAGDDFYLWPESEASVAGVLLPDFNIAFYSSAETRIQTEDDDGRISGTVHPNASFAIVWMNTGPESPFNQIGGARFNFGNNCDGPPSGF